MRILRYFLHLLQAVLVYGIYLVDDLYKNHLGFMRNVSFYSHKFDASMFGSKLFLLPLLLMVISLLFILKKRSGESILLFALAVLFLFWQVIFSLEAVPIYYLVSGILAIAFLLQIIAVFLKRSKSVE